MYTLSIVTITLNNIDLLKKTIKSLSYQMTDECEYLVIDGASKDGTVEYLDDKKINYISEKDDGIYDAMNKGLKKASGKWIYYLNAGDELLPGALEKFIEKAKGAEFVDAIYGNVILTTQYNKRTYYLKEMADQNPTHLNKGMICSHQGIFCRRTAMLEIGGFDISYRIAGDWDLIARLYRNSKKFQYFDCTIALYDQNGASIKPHLLERHRVRKKNKLYKIVDLYIIKDLLHDVKSVTSSWLLGNKKKAIAIKVKGYKQNIEEITI